MILREHRIRRPDWNELYNAAFLNADDGILQFDLTNGAGSKLIMKISGVVDNRFRVIIEEPDLHRYRIQFCLEKEPETNEEHTSGIFVHNGAEMWVEIDTDEMSAYFMVDAGLLDLFVLMGPTLSETVRQYTDLTGKPHLPQLWALGHHQSRWAYNNTEDVKDIIGKFDEYRFPMDVLWLDIEYTADRKWFTWNTTSFPDPIALLDWVEEQGHRKLVPISESNIKVDPEYKIYDDCLRNDYFINNANGTPFVSVCWAGDVSWIDFLNPEAREYYAQLHLYENFPSTSTLGGYWNDMNEPALFDNTYERTIPSEAVQYGNVKHRDVHNMYGLHQLWALGHHQSRWAYNNTEDVKDIIGKFDEYRFPMDVLWLDIEYTADRKWFTWNTTSFPDPIALLDWVEEQGHRKLVPISESNIKVDPEYKIYDDCLRNDYFINNANGTPFVSVCWAGDVSWIDFLNPEAREYYAQLHLYENFPSTSTLGGYWNDMNEPALFDNTYERTIPSEAVQYGNVKHRDVHNMYGLHQVMTTHQGLMNRDEGNLRPFLLSRSIFAGSQRYTAKWNGDTVCTFEYLRILVPMTISSNLAGLVFYGGDVPGFFGKPTDELASRWYQVSKDILVANVYFSEATSLRVYLPGENEFWYQATGPSGVFEGGHWYTIPVDISFTPVFYRSGSIIARKPRVGRTTADIKDDPHELHVVVDDDGFAETRVYIDDFESFEYLNEKKYLYVNIEWDDETQMGTVTPIDGASDSSKFTFEIESVIIYRNNEQRQFEYQETIRTKVEPMETLRSMGLDELSIKIFSVQVSTKRVCSRTKPIDNRLSANTMALLEERRQADRHADGYKALNKTIRKEIRKDLRNHNTQLVHRTIAENTSMRVLRSRMARRKTQKKRTKAPGEDKVTTEMLKMRGEPLEKALLILLNKCLQEQQIPTAWKNAELIRLFKIGDCARVENYRPISLLSTFYKLLRRIVINCLTSKFDFY
ncbi:hypothetical protein YQE_03634 [Dendroctonus ponderosae]|uniref:Glycoside hydrolase family 31 TIM barrel domain-containing protein n=1 Tax=Dendroctonus ponderosae TaxID=77166 RepID=N6UDZ5_DENPD|nr:hypothetical protein YQE_03634 [Dendroctonus ponderosae]